MSAVFGGNGGGISTDKMHLPLGSVSWSIGGLIDGKDSGNITLYSFDTSDEEVVDVKRCFNEITHMFVFGRNLASSYVRMHLICFIGEGCSTGKSSGLKQIDALKKKYEKQRVYKKKASVAAKIDSFSYNGFIVGMRVGEVNPANGTCIITITMLMDNNV